MFTATIAPGAYYDDYAKRLRYTEGETVQVSGFDLDRGRYYGVFI